MLCITCQKLEEGQTLADWFLLDQMAMACNSVNHLLFVTFLFLMRVGCLSGLSSA